MSVIITKNKTVFYCNTCNNTLSGGNFVAMQQIIFNCGWVILPNKIVIVISVLINTISYMSQKFV